MVKELLEGIHLVASLEAISLGTKAGIHPWIIYDIISNAAGNSWCVLMQKTYFYISSKIKRRKHCIGLKS